MNNDLDGFYRVGIYIRRQGHQSVFTDEIKSEDYRDLRELDEELNNMIHGNLASLEEELRDEDETN